MATSVKVSSSVPGVTSREEHPVPAGVLFPLVELVKHWSVAPDELLRRFGLREQDFTEPQTRFPHALYIAIIEHARKLTGEKALGFFWGLQMRISVFGYLGFATMSTATLRDAIELAIQFAPLGSTAEGMRLHVEGDVASLVLEEHADFGGVRDVVTVARLTGLWRIAEALIGRDLHATAEAAIPEPSYHARFAHLVPEIRYGRPTPRALMKAESLTSPLVSADPVALPLAT